MRRHPPELLTALEGRKLTRTGRHGKYLLLEWDDGQVLVVHLRMSGQLLAAQPDDPLAKHTHAVLTFAGAGELRFVDPRTFGEFFLATPVAPDEAAAGSPGANIAPSSPGVWPNSTTSAPMRSTSTRRAFACPRRPPGGAQDSPGRPKGHRRCREYLCRRDLLRCRPSS